MTPAALAEERECLLRPCECKMRGSHNFQWLLTGEVYECAVQLSAQAKDTAEFERHMALLTPYYTDFG